MLINPSLLFLVSQFCTPPEVKFHVFSTSKHGEVKLLLNIFLSILLSILWRFYRESKKNCHIHFNRDDSNTISSLHVTHNKFERPAGCKNEFKTIFHDLNNSAHND